MIVAANQARLILSGRKTQHRIPRKPNERRCPYRGGRSYVLQSRSTGKDYGRVRVLSTGSQWLEAISEQEAHVEGFPSRDEFLGWFKATYPPWIDQVWVLVIEPDEELRLLVPASRGSAASEHGYTSNPARAMRHEPEAVDEQTQQRLTQEARELYRDALEDRLRVLEELPLTKRLEWVERQCTAARVKSDLRVIRERLEDAKRKAS